MSRIRACDVHDGLLAWIDVTVSVTSNLFQLDVDELQVGRLGKEGFLGGMCDIANVGGEVQGKDSLVGDVVSNANRAKTMVLHGAVRRKLVDGEVAFGHVDVFTVGSHFGVDIVCCNIAFVVEVAVHPKTLRATHRLTFKAGNVSINKWLVAVNSCHFEDLWPGTLSGDDEFQLPDFIQCRVEGKDGIAIGVGDAEAKQVIAIEQADAEVVKRSAALVNVN